MNDGVAGMIAALTLLISCGMIAIGVLSFFNYQYFKTKFLNRASLPFGLALLLVTEAVFMTTGVAARYLSGQKNDVTECEYQVEQAYPQERRTNPALVRGEIVGCMDRVGYEWTTEHNNCKEAPLATNAFCYLPKDVVSRVIVSFQTKFE
jgi:hypothetical protein